MQGKVSMVMPCYNKVKYIGEMFDSILAQKWDNIELILVNDGSTDGTREVIAAYEPKFIARGYEVVIVDQENAGVCAAAKAGLMRVTGDYVCQVDSDDELDPEYVSTMAGWLEEHGEYDIAACEGVHYTGSGAKKKFSRFNPIDIADGDPLLVERYLLGRCRATVWIYMLRATYFHACRIAETYYTATKGSHEPGYIIPLRAYGGKLKFFALPLYRFNQSGEGHSQSKRFEQALSFYEEYEKLSHIAIDALPDTVADARKRQSWHALAEMYHDRCLYGRAIALPGGLEHAERCFLQVLDALNGVFELSPKITREDAQNAEKLLVRAAAYLPITLHAQPITPPKGRVIGYGAMGRNARMLMPILAGTALDPDELWDAAGDGVTVRQPNLGELTDSDTVLMFPDQSGILLELSEALAAAGCAVVTFDRLIVYAARHRFPQLAAWGSGNTQEGEDGRAN